MFKFLWNNLLKYLVIGAFFVYSWSAYSGEEAETLQTGKNETVKIAVLDNFPPFSFDMKGRTIGFTIDYIKLLEEKSNVNFEIVSGTWKNNLQKFKSGEVDAISAISYTKSRTEFTRFTDPYYIIPTVVYTRENTFDYKGVSSLKGKKVGIESGVFYKKYLEKYESIRLEEIEDTPELLKQLSFGSLDAVVTNINIGNFMVKQYALENVKLGGRINIPEIKDEDLRIGVQKDKKQLFEKISEGVNQVLPREYKSLQDRWIGFTPSKMLQENLMPSEYSALQEYNEKYGGIRVGSRGDWFPVDFWSDNRIYKGIASDIFSEIENSSEVSFVYKNTKSLSYSLNALKNEEIDIIPAVVPSNEIGESISLTKPYVSLPLVIVTGGNEIFIQNVNNLAGKNVGYVDRGILGSILESKYPKLKINRVETTRAGLQRVKNGKDFAFIGNLPSITYVINKHGFFNVKISGTLSEKLPIAAAVKNDNEEIFSILQKKLHGISLSKRSNIVENWVSIRMDENVDYTVVWMILTVAGAVLAVSFFYTLKIKKLNRKISQTNNLLSQKNKELSHVSVTDKLTGLYNRSKIDIEIDKEIKRFKRSSVPFTLLLLDIDHFKFINDDFGHIEGDRVLRSTAEIISDRCRETDIVGRWGGEEFLVLCPDTDISGGVKLAEDIRNDFETHDFGLNRKVTVSAGVASYVDSNMTLEDIIKRADSLLYEAKNDRNRVCYDQLK